MSTTSEHHDHWAKDLRKAVGGIKLWDVIFFFSYRRIEWIGTFLALSLLVLYFQLSLPYSSGSSISVAKDRALGEYHYQEVSLNKKEINSLLSKAMTRQLFIRRKKALPPPPPPKDNYRGPDVFEKCRSLVLVGIVALDPQYAIIESRRDRTTVDVYVGDEIDGMKVTSIKPSGVTVEFRGETTEIK